ncbi:MULTISPECIES: TetR/AcrR family transcriptional regulator [Pseudonocardia]|uniref:Bacterial regulatory protein n=2 Tax=Pseudonocardia TaxID=1847 RepID=A0A1Y2MMK5_PSEAH|nr:MULTISPECIES: TetR/AcrR family transcriptional regulator [Pseudonocardia]OSY35897.1 Bacterial regulatory protein [Pseudonocardia autotrophica]TDN73995.1 TetR family transcriptional regulator [Pseudonocardia autotrophica]BBG04752.1 TetR family transcriptional regulator [Pseudonocardia autotrophica]GEC28690.1 TetR family transcriptional regulator [Pseudonocardia saturnea]
MTIEKPLRADARRNREAIVAAAREVFVAGRFFDMRFDDLAGLAGVGTGTLYRNFPTREALAEAVYRSEIATMSDHARRLGATRPADEALAVFLRDMVDHIDAHQGLARTLATLMSAGSRERNTSGHELEDAVAELVAKGIAEGSLRDDIDAGAVLMALHGIGAAHARPGWRAEADGVVTLVVDGLRRGTASP